MSTDLAEFLDGPAPDDEPEIQVDEPIDQRVNLTELGIEETERGVCEDTFENRSIIRRAKLVYQPLYDQHGRPTGLITVVSPESMVERRIQSLAMKRPLLVDPDNRNSDYLTGLDLILEERAVQLTPPWVIGSTKTWIAQEENGGTPPPGRRRSFGLPGRCRTIKTDGIRCMLWHSGRPNDDGLCRLHLKVVRKTSDDIERARKKLVQAAPYAVDVLEELMESAESEPVRLKASTEILDRAGIRGGQDFTVDMEVTDNRPASQVVLERLGRLAQGAAAIAARLEADELEESEDGTVVDAEIVLDEPDIQEQTDREMGTTSPARSSTDPAPATPTELLLERVKNLANGPADLTEDLSHELEDEAGR